MGKVAAAVKRIVKAVLFLLIFALLFWFAERLLQAKWVGNQSTTSVWEEYRSLPENSVDVLFAGTSEVYSGIDPMYLYDASGITSFIISSGAIRFDMLYLALQEALKTQTPEVIFLDMSPIRYRKSGSEANIHTLIDQMPLSLSKLTFVLESDCEELSFLDALFPFFRYHSRWDELDETDFQYVSGDLKMTCMRGHFLSYKTREAEWAFYENDDDTYQATERAMTYLGEIADLCEKKGIELILFKIPAPEWRQKWSDASAEAARQLGVQYLELTDEADEMGLDPASDFRDAKKHMNQNGAEKMTAYLADYLEEHYDFTDKRGSAQRWDEDLTRYHKLIESRKKKASENS